MRSAFMFLAIVLFMAAPLTAAEEKSVAEEILDVLYDTGQINKATHDRLLEKARVEEAKRADKTMTAEPPAQAPKKKKGEDLRVFWDKGLKAESEDKAFKFASTGRVFLDFATTGASDEIEEAFGFDNVNQFGSFFNSARIGINGVIYDRFTIKADYDFGGGDVDFADVYAGVLKLSIFDEIRIGHQKYPLSISEQTSRKHIPFMERSLPNDALYVNPIGGGLRDTGIRTISTFFDKRLGVNLAYYIDADAYGTGRQVNDNTHLMARVHGTPWKDGNDLVHLGLGWRRTFVDDTVDEMGVADDPIRFRGRATTRFISTRFVDTGNFAADTVDLINAEAALNYGPFTVQGEFFYDDVKLADGVDGGDPSFSGWYAWAAWLITGEEHRYNAKNGGWGKVVPKKNLFDDGWGAFELAARFASIDLSDEEIEGGEQRDITLGLNWHMTPNLVWKMNYGHAFIDDRTVNGVELDNDTFHVLQTRFQFDF